MIFSDAHCDTITLSMRKNESIYKNSCHLDINRMKKTGFNHLQFFSIFYDKMRVKDVHQSTNQAISFFKEQISYFNNDITLCRNYNDILTAFSDSKISAFLTIEGGEAIKDDLSLINYFYEQGVRSICLTWNHKNNIGSGVYSDSNENITPFGVDVIKRMNDLGMIVDVSHLSEKSFWDIISHSSHPIIASHSNSKKICPHIRNLTNEQILGIKKTGGFIGINLYPCFLAINCEAEISDIIKHIEHIAGIAGEDILGFGCDFDGVDCLPHKINGIEDVSIIINELLRLNYSDNLIKKISGKNLLKTIEKIC